MTSIVSNTQPTAWVGIDIAKRQNDVLVDRPGHRRIIFPNIKKKLRSRRMKC
jgi:hypothetical protein